MNATGHFMLLTGFVIGTAAAKNADAFIRLVLQAAILGSVFALIIMLY